MKRFAIVTALLLMVSAVTVVLSVHPERTAADAYTAISDSYIAPTVFVTTDHLAAPVIEQVEYPEVNVSPKRISAENKTVKAILRPPRSRTA